MSLHCIYSWAVVPVNKNFEILQKSAATDHLDGRDTNTLFDQSYSSLPLLPEVSPTRFMSSIKGMNIAMTMLPTTTARKTIMIGSRSEVMAATALSTSSS